MTRLTRIGVAVVLSAASLASGEGPMPRVSSHATPGTSQGSGAERRAIPPGRSLWDHQDEPGVWLPWELTCTPVEAAGQRVWVQQLQAIAAMVRALPVFREMRGYYPMMTGCVQRSGIPTDPYVASIALTIWPPVTVERTAKGEPRVRRVWRHNGLGGLFIHVNSFGDLRHDWPTHSDNEGVFFELPEADRDLTGFPVLRTVFYVSPPNKPPLFVPVTRERALRWILDHLNAQASTDAAILESARRQYEEFMSPAGRARRAAAIEEAAASQKRPENQAQVRRQAEAMDPRRDQDLKAASVPRPGSPQAQTAERAAQLTARLAGMNAEQRRQPAWYQRRPGAERWPDYGEIVDPDTPGARPLVTPNEQYFDRSQPKTTMQLVRTSVVADCVEGEPGPAISGLCLRVVEQMDWRAVAAMLK